jgi:hypothetical protein
MNSWGIMDAKVAICIPSNDIVPMSFALCLAGLMAHCATYNLPTASKSSVLILNKRCSILPKSRQELLEMAIERGCTHALFIDSDQTFPINLLHELFRHRLPLVACNIPTKSMPANTTARTFNPEWHGGDPVYSDGNDRTQVVWRVGCGVMLIELSILTAIPKPWFSVTYDSVTSEWAGEDWGFVSLLQAHGFRPIVNHVMSRMVGHVGSFEFTHEWVGSVAGEPKNT